MSDIAKHTPELAQAVVDAGAVAYLAPLIVNPDGKLKRQVQALAALILSSYIFRYMPGNHLLHKWVEVVILVYNHKHNSHILYEHISHA